MADININYKGYILTDSYTIKDKTYVPVSILSHKERDKAILVLDVYKMGKVTRINRVGILFYGLKERNIKFTIDKNTYVMSLKDGIITSMKKFQERNVVTNSYQKSKYQTLNWLLSQDETYKYQILGRMQSDCQNYTQSKSHLWGININDHITYMTELYKSLKVKPNWLSIEQINNYKRHMIERG